MKEKSLLIIICLIICVLFSLQAISAVSVDDTNTTVATSEGSVANNTNSILSYSPTNTNNSLGEGNGENNNPVKAGEKTFTQLNGEIHPRLLPRAAWC